MIGIYKIQNKINGKIYIGQSNDIKRRFSEHKYRTPRFRLAIDWAIVKYGIDNFDFSVIEECKEEELDEKESYWIKKFNSKEEGYNFSDGGENNSRGSNNGRAKIKEEDVIIIRKAYSNHERQKEVYNKCFKDKISFLTFQGIWQGENWINVMPEVFTEENKRYYIYNNCKNFSDEEVAEIRKRYVKETAKEIYKDYSDRCTLNSFRGVLSGQTYKNLPHYNKKEKKWINNEPVSTISESGE